MYCPVAWSLALWARMQFRKHSTAAATGCITNVPTTELHVQTRRTTMVSRFSCVAVTTSIDKLKDVLSLSLKHLRDRAHKMPQHHTLVRVA